MSFMDPVALISRFRVFLSLEESPALPPAPPSAVMDPSLIVADV